MCNTDSSKSRLSIVLVAIVLVSLSVGALFLLRVLKVCVVERVYADIHAVTESLPLEVESGKLSAAEASEQLLQSWEGITGSQISAADFAVVLPAPLQWTGTSSFPNDDRLRDEGIQNLVGALRSVTGEDHGDRIESWRSSLASSGGGASQSVTSDN